MIAEEMSEVEAACAAVNEYYAGIRLELCVMVRLGFSG
jgi:hypothetical protein